MKRAVIVHCWSGHPEDFWYPWLGSQLEDKGYKVDIPTMPNTYEPQIGPWVSHLSQVLGTPDQEVVLIGHSIGCQTILRYLETLPEGVKIGKVVLVASWLALTGLDEEEKINSYEKSQKEIARPWLETPLDFDKVKTKSDKFVVILSTDDPYVPYEVSAKNFKDLLGAEIITLQNKGHFDEEDFVELPEALEPFN